MYTWKLASPEEFQQIRDLFLSSELGQGREYDVQRRVATPLRLKQIISMYYGKKFCGFISVAFLNADSEAHMATHGVQANDWRSGENFWVIDAIAAPGYDGYKILRTAMRGLRVKKARYFRHKHQNIRELRERQ